MVFCYTEQLLFFKQSSMRIRITARHLKLTEALASYIREKVSKAEKYLDPILWVQVILSVEKHRQMAEIILHASRQTFRAQAVGADLYSAIDLALDKVQSQLKKHKEKIRERKGKSATLYSEGLPEAGDGISISVTKRIPLRPMSPPEAVEEMERMGYHFWMFYNDHTNQVNVIYRRLDESYGLLQPAKKTGGKP